MAGNAGKQDVDLGDADRDVMEAFPDDTEFAVAASLRQFGAEMVAAHRSRARRPTLASTLPSADWMSVGDTVRLIVFPFVTAFAIQ